MGTKSLKRRPRESQNPPMAAVAPPRRKLRSYAKASVVLSALLVVSVIALLVLSSNKLRAFQRGVSYQTITVVNVFPHDPQAFTQGLVYDRNDTLFESTGLYGKVENVQKMDSSLFGEGLTLLNNRLFQVTWLQKAGFVYNPKNLRKIGTFNHDMKDGWGLATDGKVLFGSDGSSTLYQIDPQTFKALSKQVVYYKGHQVHNLNELEYINGEVWANVFMCWVYEHFPAVANMIADEDYVESQPRAYRWKPGKALPVSTYHRRLDRLMTDAVCWTPYTDHRAARAFEVINLYSCHIRWGPYCVRYHPERVRKQFGFIQSIPSLLSLPTPSNEEIDESWLHFSQHLTVSGAPSSYPGQCDVAYLDWFYQISHLFMTPPQPGELRAPPAVPDPAPDPPASMAEPMVEPEHDEPDMPRHAVGVCQTIAERLRRLIDLRMVTDGTDAYDIVEQCITLARSVCDDQRVYVRSRHPRNGPRRH